MRRPKVVRRLVKALVALAFLAGLLVAADALARHVTEDALAGRAMKATGAAHAQVSLSGWPFLYDVLVAGRVPEVDVRLSNVPIGRLDVAELAVHLRAVTIAAGALVVDRRVEVRSISSAFVSVQITASALSAAAGQPVVMPGGGVIQVGRGVVVSNATVIVQPGPVLVVQVSGVSVFRIDLGNDRLIPQCTMHVAVLLGGIRATCTVAPVPRRVIEALAGTSH